MRMGQQALNNFHTQAYAMPVESLSLLRCTHAWVKNGGFPIAMIEQIRLFTKSVECKCVELAHQAVISGCMRSQSYLNRLILLAVVFIHGGTSLRAQFHDGSNVEFGKNRVQYQSFDWQYFPIEGAEVYYYQGGKALASHVVVDASLWIKDVEKLLDRTIEKPIQFLVFNKQEDFRQSNIGGSSSEDENIGGTAILVGSKIFLYGKGERSLLEQDVKRGLTELLFNQSMNGGSWQDALRNNTSMSFPEWYKEGLYSYASAPWSAAVSMHAKDAARCGLIRDASRANETNAPWVGHAIWKYIADVFGEPVIANVLYMTRVTRSVEKGIQYATGMDLEMLFAEASQYHLSGISTPEFLPPLITKKDLRQSQTFAGDVPFKLKKHLQYRSFSIHPDGQHGVLVTEERGQISLWYVDLIAGSKRRIGRHGHKIDRIQDDSFPVLAWHPNGRIVTYTLEEKGSNFLINVDLNSLESKRKELFQIDKVLSMTYAPDGMTMIWSAMKNGQSDLYRYQVLSNNQRPLWTDPYDDLDPVISDDGSTIWFASNRPNADLNFEHALGQPIANSHDLFALNWDADVPSLIHWVETPLIDERHPQIQRESVITFLAEQPDGSQDRSFSWRDSTIASIDTSIHYRLFTQTRIAESLEEPIGSFQEIPSIGSVLTTSLLHGHAFFRWQSSNSDRENNAALETKSFEPMQALELDWDWSPSPTEADFRAYAFGPWTPKEEVSISAENSAVASAQNTDRNPRVRSPDFTLPKPRNYRRNYAIESVKAQLDNSFGNSFYQPYTGSVSLQPGLGGLTMTSMSDLFEDRRFTIGFRLAGSLDNSTYAMAYSNLANRWDKTWSLERQGVTQATNGNQSLVKTHIHLLRHRLTYPFDEVRSLRIQGVMRLDRNVPLSIDAYNLKLGTDFTTQWGAEIAYVFDNSRTRRLNIREGTRYRIWAEYLLDGWANENTFGTFGFDFRHYKPLFRDIIFAVRAAGNWSLGRQKLLHFMGGVDNVLSLKGPDQSPVDPGTLYAFQTQATPIRGFRQNARNGSNMALINAEVRIPIWSTLSSRAANSDLLEHLQCVGFTDVGSAWNGKHPYDESNTFNQITVTQNPITVTIDNNREPIIWGAGMGLRSYLFGYWVRADWCWGVDDGRWSDRLFVLSLNLDF
jgi:hypothetical protein